MDQIIREAIQSRKVLQFYYDGGPRTVEPFCYGIGKTGKYLLRGYQTGGYSQSGNPEGWRLFDTAKMIGVQCTDTQFAGTRPRYQPNDSSMAQVLICI